MDNTRASSQQLNQVCENYWNFLMKQHPLWATGMGVDHYDHLLPDLSVDSRHLYYLRLQPLRDAARAIDASQLDHHELVTLDILKQAIELEFEGSHYYDYRWNISPLSGTQVWIADLGDKQPVATPEQLDRLLSRFSQVPRVLMQERANLREGLLHQQVAFSTTVERVVAQIQRLLTGPAESSPFCTFRDGNFSDTWRAHIKEELAAMTNGTVRPALAEHLHFLQTEYLPHARTTPGLASIPDGAAYYQFLSRYYTDFPGTAQDIHQVGLEELARIHTEMKAIALKLGGTDNIRAFAETLHERKDQFAENREELVNFNQQVVARALEALPRVFSRLPRRTVEVKAIEAFREADSPSGYYSRAPSNGDRPGYYYVNTHRAQGRPLFNMEALAFHEAVPGHHLQIALAQELEDLPEFRKHTGQTAFIEGWALYSERLADELGLYSSDIARFGMLSYQAWRASRLVVDTGLHALGWSRQQGIDFLVSNTAHTLNEAVVEVDRYITMPAQALSYMIGRLAIDALRKRAQDSLGSRFDLKEFHARVLENGAVPLASLRTTIDRWIHEQSAA